MTIAKEFLKQYEEAERKVRQAKYQYQEEQEKIDSIRSSVNDGTPHSGQISKTVEIQAMRLAEKALIWREAEADALRIQRKVAQVIYAIPGVKSDVLFERYMNLNEDGRLRRWDDVARSVNYSRRQVHNLHQEALEDVLRILEHHTG